MPTPHPHHDVIRAYADGYDVQIYDPLLGDYRDTEQPMFDPTAEYRVKPLPRAFRVALLHTGIHNNAFPLLVVDYHRDNLTDITDNPGFIRWATDPIEY